MTANWKSPEALAFAAFGRILSTARKTGTCVKCGEEALPKCYSEAGRKEYEVSALCEECFDSLFSDE